MSQLWFALLEGAGSIFNSSWRHTNNHRGCFSMALSKGILLAIRLMKETELEKSRCSVLPNSSGLTWNYELIHVELSSARCKYSSFFTSLHPAKIRAASKDIRSATTDAPNCHQFLQTTRGWVGLVPRERSALIWRFMMRCPSFPPSIHGWAPQTPICNSKCSR